MQLSPNPYLGSRRSLVLTALAVGLAVCVVLVWGVDISRTLGDTDDAVRLVQVRDLAGGKGWYDQWVGRVAPPEGMYLHWSRLIDGALAACLCLARQFLSERDAEWAVRFFWPLAWVFPALICALTIARNIGPRSSVFAAALFLLVTWQAYRQFVPGRIDHHNIQIVMTLTALAAATKASSTVQSTTMARWGVLAGLASAVGLAVGLEALVFHALVGAAFALGLVRERAGASSAIAYGLALAGGAVTVFLIQTPPWRWGLALCDSLAVNLVAALSVAGCGLALASLARNMGRRARLAMVSVVGVLAAGTYLGLDPACIHGPFAAVDPRVHAFWWDRIQELQSLDRMFVRERGAAIVAVVMFAMALLGSAILVWSARRRPSSAVLLVVTALGAAIVQAWFAWRMQDYLFWIGAPVVGAGMAIVAAKVWRDRMVPTLAASLFLTPTILGGAASNTVKAVWPDTFNADSLAPGKCFDHRAYTALSQLAPGIVLAPVDLGPYIIADTGHSVVAAPYHRISLKVLAAHQAMDAPPARAEALVRSLHATYFVDCPPYPLAVGPQSLAETMRAGQVPSWLQKVSAPGATLSIYRVLPSPK